MKNKDIMTLVGAGILQATVHTLDPAHAYKFAKFKSAVKAAWEDIRKSQDNLLIEAGIDKNKDIAEDGRFIVTTDGDADRSRIDKYKDMEKALLEDDSEIQCNKIPYVEWMKLYNENASKTIDRFTIDVFGNIVTEEILAGLLFDYPKDEPSTHE